ncbi:uncharacterized protein LOC126902761 [Daktulosphaira vitifoliae]|uniref:uncharacterized protein LOC126902761 n=1 Tax=Daktulosphaira vitifoliae TaxID=58002 RepID=UPI0021AB03DE|nr:uncharacterized protein LOC126902761 [Daktulosphaira vitifoliae]
MCFYYYFGIFLYSVCVFITLTNSAGTSSNNDPKVEYPFATICKGLVHKELAPYNVMNIETVEVLKYGFELNFRQLGTYAIKNNDNKSVKLQGVLDFMYNHFKEQETIAKECFLKCPQICENTVDLSSASLCIGGTIFFEQKLLRFYRTKIFDTYTSFGNRFHYKDMFDNFIKDFGTVLLPESFIY